MGTLKVYFLETANALLESFNQGCSTVLLSVQNNVEKFSIFTVDHWFPTTAPGTTSAP